MISGSVKSFVRKPSTSAMVRGPPMFSIRMPVFGDRRTAEVENR